MTTTPPDPGPELEREVRRVTERLAFLSPARYAETLPDGRTRSEAVRSAAEELVVISARMERRTPPDLPPVADRALADVVAVTATDVLLAGAPPEQVADAVEQALGVVRALRRAL